MKNVIACEGFEMTPAIRDHVEQTIEGLADCMPRGEKVEVFLSHPGKRSFTALFKVHHNHRDVIAKDSEENLYKAVTLAANHLERQLREMRDKEITKRRKTRGFEEDSMSALEDPISS